MQSPCTLDKLFKDIITLDSHAYCWVVINPFLCYKKIRNNCYKTEIWLKTLRFLRKYWFCHFCHCRRSSLRIPKTLLVQSSDHSQPLGVYCSCKFLFEIHQQKQIFIEEKWYKNNQYLSYVFSYLKSLTSTKPERVLSNLSKAFFTTYFLLSFKSPFYCQNHSKIVFSLGSKYEWKTH